MPGYIGQYQILEKIGAGGMATVYKGLQPSLDRLVAIKILARQLSGRESMIKRFNRESTIVARLAHPNIIHIIDRGTTADGLSYFVMDFVQGTDLQKEIKKGSYTLTEKMEIMVQVCKALDYAHKNGVVHRDIKPANILIDGQGHAMVADFGIAQLVDEHMTGATLTREGMVLGTLAYMSPEQSASAKNLTPASDIYSLGVVMYELFTGARPTGYFKSPMEHDPNIPRALDEIILQCLSPEPEDRVKSADAIKEVLLNELKGAHLGGDAKVQAQGIGGDDDSLVLLDIIKEHKFGAVYLFRRKQSGKLMVVKKYTASVGGLPEAQAFLKLKHKNIVNVAGASGNNEIYIAAMEYIRGGSLEERMARPYEWRDALAVVRQICEGLAFAYSHKVLHGNLRPSNIMISNKGVVKLTDFGLKEHYGKESSNENWYNPFKEPKSHLTDIYSTGAILHKMITGILPIWRQGQLIIPHSLDSTPREVRDLVRRMLSRKAEENFRSAGQVINAIDGILAADEKTRLQEQEAAASKPAPSPAPKRKTQTKRQIMRLLLFLLFVEAVIYYLFSTGQASRIMSFWMDLIQKIPI